MTEPLERARALIALALSTHSTEEARTTALIAVRMIAQHGLLDSPKATFGADFWARASDMAARAREQPKRENRWNYREHRRADAPEGCAWIRAKFDSKCLWCRGAVEEGESVMWEKGHGVIHEDCWPVAEAGARV